MRQTFHKALSHVLSYEGGYVNHPLDPGGATNMGITLQTLECFRGEEVTRDDILDLTYEEASDIYFQNYWRAANCGYLPQGIDFALFDASVNQGVLRSIKLLQKSADVYPDGKIGPITLRAVQTSNQIELLNEFSARRMRCYGGLTRLFKTFGLGWSRRLIATHTEALKLIIKETDDELYS